MNRTRPRKIQQRASGFSLLAGSLLLAAISFGVSALPAAAEGSRELIGGSMVDGVPATPGTNRRPSAEWRPNRFVSTPPIPRQTIIRVYAQAGETINVGSSAIGVGAGNARIYLPTATVQPGPIASLPAPAVNCVAQGTGFLSTRAQELAGPAPAAGGYTPCTLVAATTGIYSVVLIGPAGDNPAGNTEGFAPQAPTVNDNPNNVSTDQSSATAIFDVTVTSGGVALSGRAFTSYLALYTRANGADYQLNGRVFIATPDGYTYRAAYNQLDPNGYVFFSNKFGFTTNDEPIYRSVPLLENTNQILPNGVQTALPNIFATTRNLTNALFFNQPDPAVLAALGYAAAPIAPPLPLNFAFTGSEGTPNQAGSNPLGGTFTFTNPVATGGSYTIVIRRSDTNAVVRTLLGFAAPGANSVFWDGNDNNGVNVPIGNFVYNAEITINFGEVHFPLLDAENFPGGFLITRTVPGGANVSRVFYDDTVQGTLIAPLIGTPPNPIRALPPDGILSALPGVHGFTTYGDIKGIDTWAYFSSTPVQLQGGIVVKTADLVVNKGVTPTTLTAGGPVTFTIVVTNNNGPSPVGGPRPEDRARFQDTIPAQVTNVTWTCTPSTGSSCTSSGTGNNIVDNNLTLPVNGTVTYTVSGTVSPAFTGALSNTATVFRPNDVDDPVDNGGTPITNTVGSNSSETSTVTVTVNPPLPIVGITKQVAGQPIDNLDGTFTIPYTIRVSNLGVIPLVNVQVVEDLTGVYAAPATFNVVAGSVAATGAAVNPAFTGTAGNTNLLAATQPLAVGANAEIRFQVLVTPNANFGPYLNSATATATDSNGNPTTDISDNGNKPDPNGNGNPNEPGENDPTPVTLSPTPRIGVAKQAGTPTNNGDGTFTVPFTVLVRNYGNTVLNNVQITENLTTTFPGLTFAIAQTPRVTGSLSTGNASFNGTSNVNLLSGLESLNIGESATITFAARVTLNGNFGPFNNFVTASGTSPNNVTVTDPSQSSVGVPIPDPDPDGDGDPGNNNDVTPVPFTPNLALVKRITSVTRGGAILGGVNFGGFVNDSADAASVNGAGLTPLGVPSIPASTATLQSGDEIEYTVYFVSNGGGAVLNAGVCDQIRPETTFVVGSNQVKPTSAAPVGAGGQYFAPLAALTLGNPCTDQGNPNGSLIFNLGTVPNQPAGSNVGFVRFRMRLN